MQLHRQIFQENPDKEEWNKRLLLNGKIYVNECSYIVSYEKFPEITHIWLAGTLEEARGKGKFKELLMQLLEDNTNPKISINSYPDKWPIMVGWIKKKGFQLIKVCDDGKHCYEIKAEDFV